MPFPFRNGFARLRPYRPVNVCLLALSFTLLNAFKPLHIDDPSYFTYAAEFSKHPLNPYDFEYGSPIARPANQLLVPPVAPYWWGLGLRFLGSDPFLWKLWMFPFALLLAGSLALLYRRFAPGVETPLLWLTMFSPALLPSFNCMLEVPVLGLSLAALALVMAACDRGSWSLTVLGGLLAGLAIQTKYTALVTLAAIVLWSILKGRARLGLLAGALALLVFVSWEVFVAFHQGQSHFLVHLGQRNGGAFQRCLHLVLPLFSLVGGLAPAVLLLGLSALGWSRRRVAGAAAVIVLAFLALALTPDCWATFLQDPQTHEPRFTLANVIYGSLGLLAWGTTAMVARRLFQVSAVEPTLPSDPPSPRIHWFLVGWLVLEVMGYFALSPFPAARRVEGVLLVVTFLAGRLASCTCRTPSQLALVRGVAVTGVLLGLFFFGVDWWDARASQKAAELASRRQWESGPGNTTWYLSWWGFGFYAERAGIKPLVLNQTAPRPGDVILVPENPQLLQELQVQLGNRLELLDTLSVTDPFPLCMVPCYYAGRTPLEHHEGPRLTVRIFRIGADSPRTSDEGGKHASAPRTP